MPPNGLDASFEGRIGVWERIEIPPNQQFSWRPVQERIGIAFDGLSDIFQLFLKSSEYRWGNSLLEHPAVQLK